MPANHKSPDTAVSVWDISIRVFHWALALSVGFLWYSGEEGGNIMTWHMYIGYCLLGLITYRVIWGVIGSRYARFSAFLKGPRHTLHYLKNLLKGQEPQYLSHNPLGGWMTAALILLLLLQASTGLFATDDIFTEGPLFSLVSESTAYTLTAIHEINFNVILLCIIVHIIAVIYHSLVKKEGLIKSMFTGKKSPLQPLEQQSKINYPLMLISIAFSAACVYLVVNLA